MTTLRLALSELQRMTRGTLPKLAIIALSCVPLIYGALYLYANWDPQSHLSGVQAALVNLDEGAEKSGKKLQVGDDVTESLLEDGTFGWVVVDTEEEAEAGVASGDYSFAMTIPNDFSKNLASPADFENAKQGILKITTNDANNYMVGTFADKLAKTVHDSVATEVGTQTADALLTGFVDIHKNMKKAADGAGDLYTGSVKLVDGVGSLSDGVNKLVDGGDQLAKGTSDLHSGTGELHSGTSTLHSGTGDLLAGQKKLRDGSKQLAAGTGELSTGANKLSNGLSEMKQKTAKLPAAAKALNDGAAKASDASKQLASGARQVADGNAALNAKVQDAAGVITALEQDAADRLDTAESQATERLDKLVADGVITQEQADSITSEVSAAIDSAAADSKVVAEAKNVKSQLKTAQGQIQQLADGSEAVAKGAKQLSGGLGTLADGTAQLNASVPTLVNGIATAADGGKQLATGAAKLNSGANTLYKGEKSAVEGTAKLNDGAAKLDKGAAKLDDGAAKLEKGAGTLSTGLHTLRDGVGDLADGAGQLSDGSNTLADGLSDGTKQVPNPDDPTKQKLSEVIGDPVEVTRTDQTKAMAYGEGLAPFFMTLATWIGAFILTQVMRPITKRALASNAPNWKIAIGGWLPFFLISVIQSSILYGVVIFWLGLNTAHPWMTWGLFFLASMAFTALIQGICALLGTAGKFVVLVLMVLQLVTAGGTFPWETLPEPLHVLHRILPMGHVVVGMRHLMYGADLSVLSEVILGLIGYTILGLVLSTLAVRKHKTWTLKALQPELGE
ncbi:YhgE/Pip domain-containing protein [Glutamicibacter sp. PS]|uniref:YhgE/Pip domain-containing protein n=1 Tax=Glutamicibacter sp. PS TaxID=3075634 RepID=UPI002848A7A8|nr:YhgE/Pip domain-containing protein [Glutamicibacter sp. PS]MDR4533892.1 YhgE/Pip domain-containing protein [Glutamicibacter sp. PS]